MSVIVEKKDGYVLYCKGADNIIKDLLAEEMDAHADEALREFAKEGLRTLCIARRKMSYKDVCDWFRVYDAINNSTDLDTKGNKLEKHAELLEKDLELVGCTAIEDKLQEGVPETIEALHKANIKCWMLTGDKMETAQNIGITCALITKDMIPNLKKFDPKKDERSTEKEMQEQFSVEISELEREIKQLKKEKQNTYKQGLLLSGSALELVFPTPKINDDGVEIPFEEYQQQKNLALQEKLYNVCELCNAIVCCRISPRQKAEIVKLVKRCNKMTKSCITLAIGDGANDVAMIKAAHVGIGINGLEGMQAVMNSDYAIGQFRFLQNLLFVHGAWSYRRISILILYSFYKNVALSLCQVWFGFYNGWSGQVFFDPWTSASFNVFFTGFPVIAVALLNRDYSKETALARPELYRDGQENTTFNWPIFFDYFTQGIVHSLVLFFITIYMMPDVSASSGKVVDLWMVSTTCYTSCLYVVTFKLCLLTTTWTKISYAIVIFSVVLFYIYLAVYSRMFSIQPDMYGLADRLLADKVHWLVVYITCCVAMLPELASDYVKRRHYPSRVEQVKQEKLNK